MNNSSWIYLQINLNSYLVDSAWKSWKFINSSEYKEHIQRSLRFIRRLHSQAEDLYFNNQMRYISESVLKIQQ